jgi:hypothetical protein
MAIRDDLFVAARAVRTALENPAVGLPSFPRMLCMAGSRLLAKHLVEVVGVGPVTWVVNGTRILPAVNELGPIYETHFWLEYAGFIVDIAADAFRDGQEPVIVTADRRWHDQFLRQKRYPQAEALAMNQFLHERYAAMLRVMSATAPSLADWQP